LKCRRKKHFEAMPIWVYKCSSIKTFTQN